MATEIRRRRGSTADHTTFTGAPAELTVDTDKNTIVVHDGATAGGWPVPTNIETLRDVTFTSAAEEDGLVRISGVWVNTSSITSGLQVPAGTEAQRSVTGGFTIRFNTDAGAYEGYNGTAWVGLGAASADLVPYDNTSSGLTATDVQAAIDEIMEEAPWISRAIGEEVWLDDSDAATQVPPTDNENFRYVMLTAGENGSGGYNEGVLINEDVSGSAPLIEATAEVNLPGSPWHGKTIRLLNTERRFVRAGEAGVVQDDQMQQITARAFGSGTTLGFMREGAETEGAFSYGGTTLGSSYAGGGGPSSGPLDFDSADSPDARTGSETRSRNIGRTGYKRIA